MLTLDCTNLWYNRNPEILFFGNFTFNNADNKFVQVLLSNSFNARIEFPNGSDQIRVYGGSGSPRFNSPVKIPDSVTNCYNAFWNCAYYNQPTNIPNGVTNCANMFDRCYVLNSHVEIPDSVTNCSYMFSSCNKYNQPTHIPNDALDCSHMFAYCNGFKQPVRIPPNVTNCAGMFVRIGQNAENMYNEYVEFDPSLQGANRIFELSGFNRNDLVIPENFNASSLFHSATYFNQNIAIPDSVTNCYSMFYHCNSFNQSVHIPSNAQDLSSMFSASENFNSPIEIPNGAVNCTYMFSNCATFNRAVTLSNTIVETTGMFSHSPEFDQEINIPDSVVYASSMFMNTKVSRYMVGNGIVYAQNMFSLCPQFPNTPITFPPNMQVMSGMFHSCVNFNQPLTLPNRLGNMCQIVSGIPNYGHPLYVPRLMAGSGEGGIYGTGDEIDAFLDDADYRKEYTIYAVGLNKGANGNSTMQARKGSFMGLVNGRNNVGAANVYLHTDDAGMSILRNVSVNFNGYGFPYRYGTIAFTNTADGMYNSLYHLYVYNDYSG